MADFVPIQILRSPNVAPPQNYSLFPEGSLAYSYDKANSGSYARLFFSGQDSDGLPTTHIVGGKYYTEIIDSATSFNIPHTLALRDENGGIAANVTGWANYLNPGFVFNVDGDLSGNVYIDGGSNVTVTAILDDTGVNAAVYGGPNQIPVFEVDSKGRLVQAANVSLSTEIGIAADSGEVILETGNTLKIEGNAFVTTTATQPNVITIDYTGANEVLGTLNQIDVDSSNPASPVLSIPTNFVAPGSVTVTGNLVVKGTTTTVESIVNQTNDSLIKLANNNITSDVLDTGFYAEYNPGSGVEYTGLIRKASDKQYYLLDGVETDPVSNVITGGELVDLNANFTGGNVHSLANPIAVSDGGLGTGNITPNTVLVGDGTNPVKEVSGSDGQVLQIIDGEVVFLNLDAGTY